MGMRKAAASFDQVSALLPYELRRRVDELPEAARARAEELRLRVGHPLHIVYPAGEEPIVGTQVDGKTLRTVLEIASGSSVHTVMEQVRNGFIPIPGGHRLGICGTAVMKDGVMVNLRQLTSLSLRVAREITGISTTVLNRLTAKGALENTLILSPPGGGKTTLLRDMIRAISVGEGCLPLRVGVADERGELAAMTSAGPGMDLGPRTDVMDGCPKAIGLLSLLRGMNPQVLAVDEITAGPDLDAIRQAAGCGVLLLASIHAANLEELTHRPAGRCLLKEEIFRRFIVIRGVGREREYLVYNESGAPC